jgi:NADH-quinone oxidoreductase subunit N
LIGLNISLYGILLRKPNLRSSEMVIKYFISGAILTVFLIFALLLHFIQYFSFSIDMVSFLNANFEIPENIMFIDKLVYSIIISIILFKLGAFPFHFYLEDIYGILHFRNSIFIYTITLKLLMFVLLLKVINSF